MEKGGYKILLDAILRQGRLSDCQNLDYSFPFYRELNLSFLNLEDLEEKKFLNSLIV